MAAHARRSLAGALAGHSMNRKLAFLCAVAIVLPTPCCAPGAVEPVSHERCGVAPADQIEEVQTVVMQRLLQSDQITHKRRASAFYIGVKESGPPEFFHFGWDPSVELLKRFADHQPPVRPLSEAVAMGSDLMVQDRRTGEPGIIVSVTGMCWLSHADVQVQAVRFFGMNASIDFEFDLHLQSGTWRVVSEQVAGAS